MLIKVQECVTCVNMNGQFISKNHLEIDDLGHILLLKCVFIRHKSFSSFQ